MQILCKSAFVSQPCGGKHLEVSDYWGKEEEVYELLSNVKKLYLAMKRELDMSFSSGEQYLESQ